MDGKLYGIALQCSVNTLVVSESLWQNKTWDYPDIISLMEAGAASGDGPKSVMDGYSSEKLLSLLANMSIGAGKSSMVDEKAGKCYFDTEEFVELLEFCKKYGMEPGSVSGEEEMIPRLWQVPGGHPSGCAERVYRIHRGQPAGQIPGRG